MAFNKPYHHGEAPRSHSYTAFYLTLLILSTISTALSLTELATVRDAISQLAINPINAVASLANTLVVLPIAIIALVLLWRKDEFGLWLKLSTYVATIIISTVNLLAAPQTLKILVSQAVANDAKQGNSSLGSHVITTIVTSTYYAGLASAIATSIVFGVLWWFAWKWQTTTGTTI